MVEGANRPDQRHTMTAKDGRRIPGVVTHSKTVQRKQAELLSRPLLGAIGLLVGTVAEPFVTLVLAYPSGIHTPTTTEHHRQKP
jgi:hypothetical protein